MDNGCESGQLESDQEKIDSRRDSFQEAGTATKVSTKQGDGKRKYNKMSKKFPCAFRLRAKR